MIIGWPIQEERLTGQPCACAGNSSILQRWRSRTSACSNQMPGSQAHSVIGFGGRTRGSSGRLPPTLKCL